MKPRVLLAAACIACSAGAFAQNAPKQGSADHAPDEWLLASRGQPWWYETKASPAPMALKTRPPSSAEQRVIDRAAALLEGRSAKVIALVDSGSVVYAGYRKPAHADSILFGFSMGKTVTAAAVGQAICAGKLKLETRADALVVELKGTPLGKATVRDLLTMSSGAAEPLPDSSIWTPEQFKRWARGDLTILESVTEERVTRSARGLLAAYEPGEHFSYKSTDPMVLGLMLTRATAMPYAHWVQAMILDPMGAGRPGLIVQDKARDGATDAGIRLRLEDWIRFAQWIKRSAAGKDCFGEYLRTAMATQKRNDSQKGRDFGGYGYLFWTQPPTVPNTAWAVGHGGQLIGWDRDSDRMLIAFSNVDDWRADAFVLMKDWTR